MQLLHALSAHLSAFLHRQHHAPAAAGPWHVDNTTTTAPAAAAGPAGPLNLTNQCPEHAPTATKTTATTAMQEPQSPGPAPAQCPAGLHAACNAGSPAVQPGRIVEICCGILANLYSSPGLVQHLVAHAELMAAVGDLLMELEDPPALSELCRLLTAAMSTQEVCRQRADV